MKKEALQQPLGMRHDYGGPEEGSMLDELERMQDAGRLSTADKLTKMAKSIVGTDKIASKLTCAAEKKYLKKDVRVMLRPDEKMSAREAESKVKKAVNDKVEKILGSEYKVSTAADAINKGEIVGQGRYRYIEVYVEVTITPPDFLKALEDAGVLGTLKISSVLTKMARELVAGPKVERTKPGSKKKYKVTSPSGSVSYTDTKPGKSKGKPDAKGKDKPDAKDKPAAKLSPQQARNKWTSVSKAMGTFRKKRGLGGMSDSEVVDYLTENKQTGALNTFKKQLQKQKALEKIMD